MKIALFAIAWMLASGTAAAGSYTHGRIHSFSGGGLVIDTGTRTTIPLASMLPNHSCHEARAREWAHGYRGGAVLVSQGERVRVYLVTTDGPVEFDELILRAGYGAIDRAVADDATRLKEAEAEARAAQRGIWAPCVVHQSADLYAVVAKERGVAYAILKGIAMNESGRKGRPHPWTLNVHGRGFYYDTREQAYVALLGFIRKGYTSIDVGPMQVNLKFNGHRFSDLWSALDPITNIRVAADILRDNYRAAGDVRAAIAWYHSRNPAHGTPYFNRFLRQYQAASVARTAPPSPPHSTIPQGVQ